MSNEKCNPNPTHEEVRTKKRALYDARERGRDDLPESNPDNCYVSYIESYESTEANAIVSERSGVKDRTIPRDKTRSGITVDDVKNNNPIPSYNANNPSLAGRTKLFN